MIKICTNQSIVPITMPVAICCWAMPKTKKRCGCMKARCLRLATRIRSVLISILFNTYFGISERLVWYNLE